LIVGTKIDLRDGCSKISPVGQDQGEKLKMMEEIIVALFYEISIIKMISKLK